MRTIIFAVIAIGTAALASAGVHTREGAFAIKITKVNAQKFYYGDIGLLDPVKSPWRPVTQAKWAREVDPTSRQNKYALAAKADYDGDGKTDTARIYTNSVQTAVMVTFGAAKRPLVIFKTDGILAGLEVYGHGRRFLASVPEIGYLVLALYKGHPVSVADGD